MKSTFAVCVAFSVALCCTRSSGGDIRYTVTDLSRLGGYEILGIADLNDRGDMVGSFVSPADGLSHAFLYNASGFHELPHQIFNAQTSNAMAVNRHGQVAVNYVDKSSVNRAYFYDGSSAHDLGVLPGSIGTTAFGINAGGVIVGAAGDAAEPRSFVYRNAALSDLQIPSSRAAGINDVGLITGTYFTPQGFPHAYAYSEADGFTDISPVSEQDRGDAAAINAAGLVTGRYFRNTIDTPPYAFIWSASTGTIVLPISLAQGNDINDRGDVIGSARSALHGPTFPFVVDETGSYDLNVLIDPSSGWRISNAYAINNSATILGTGSFDPDGPGGVEPRGALVMLTVVPEPTCATMFVLGGAISSIRFCARRSTLVV